MTSRILTLVLAAASAHAQKPALAVVEKVAGAVGFYTADGKRVGGAQVGKHPHEIVLSPDGKQLYISDNGILWMTEAGEGGNTPLHGAAVTGQVAMTEWLLEHGAYHSPVDYEGKTPIERARQNGRLDVVHALTSHGAI